MLDLRKTISLVFLLLSLEALSSTKQIKGVSDPTLLWGKKELTLCFANASSELEGAIVNIPGSNSRVVDSDNHSELTVDQLDPAIWKMVKSAIESSFTSEKTGVTFSEVDLCSERVEKGLPASDVVLYYDGTLKEGFAALAGAIGDPSKNKSQVVALAKRNSVIIGPTAFNYNPAIESFFSDIVNFDSETTELFLRSKVRNFFLATVIHELGHVVGLFHEHARSALDELVGFLADDNLVISGVSETNSENWDEGRVFYTSYDPFSNMSYQRDAHADLYFKVVAFCNVIVLKNKELEGSYKSWEFYEKTKDLLKKFYEENIPDYKTDMEPLTLLCDGTLAAYLSPLPKDDSTYAGYLSQGDRQSLLKIYSNVEYGEANNFETRKNDFLVRIFPFAVDLELQKVWNISSFVKTLSETPQEEAEEEKEEVQKK